MSIKEAFETKENLLTGKGVSEKRISAAEEELGLQFAQDYRAYLSLYGIAAYDGHELTGLSKSKRTDVVIVTKDARKIRTDIPEDFYVVEETDVEEIVIWQKTSGEVYCSSPNSCIEKICDSMSDYISRK